MNTYWRTLIQEKPVLGWSLLLSIIATLSGLLLLAVSGSFITASAAAGMAVTGGAYSFNLLIPSSAIRALAFIRTVSRYFERLIGHSATFQWIQELRNRQFDQLRHQPLLWQTEARSTLLQRYLVDMENLEKGWLADVQPRWQLLSTGLISALVLLALLPWKLAVLLIMPLACAAFIATKQLHAARSRVEQQFSLYENLRQQAFDIRRFWTDISLWGMAGKHEDRFRSTSHDLAATLRKNALLQGTMSVLLNLSLWLALALLWYLADQDALITTMAASLLLLGWLEWIPVFIESHLQQHITALSADKLNIRDEKPPQHTNTELPEIHTAGHRLTIRNLGLTLGERTLFSSLNITMSRGESLVILGQSGSGKSSLLYTLMGLQNATTGNVLLDETNSKTVSPESWLSHFALVPQQTELLQGSLRDNLRLARPEADDATLWQVLEQVRLDRKIRQLGGLNTLVGEQSIMLSGGENKRLALARALLRDTPVILLDEPFSGLEQQTADALMQDLHQLLANRIWVMVTHQPKHAQGHTWCLTL